MGDPIRFGDIVFIQFKETRFVVSAEGFYSQHIWAGPADRITSESFRSCLFEIFPKQVALEDPFTRDYERQLENLTELNPKNQLAAKTFEVELKDQKDLEKKLSGEVLKFNAKLIEESRGKPLTHNSKFLLKHVDSGFFLDITPKTDALSRKLLSVKLSQVVSIEDYFILKSPSQLQDGDSVSEHIDYSASLYIYNPTQRVALGYDETPLKQDPLKITESKYLNNFERMFPQMNYIRQPAHIQNGTSNLIGGDDVRAKNLVMLRKYNSSAPSQTSPVESLKTDTYIRFNSLGRYLTVRYYGEHQKQYNQFRIEDTNGGAETLVNLSYAVFQIIKDHSKKGEVLPVQESVQRVEEFFGKKKVFVKQSKYLLKHLVTGRFLVACESRGSVIPVLLSLEELKENPSVFPWVEFVNNNPKEDHLVKPKSLYKLRFVNAENKGYFLNIGKKVESEDDTLKTDSFSGYFHPDKYVKKKPPTPAEWELEFTEKIVENVYEKDKSDSPFIPMYEQLTSEEAFALLEAENLFYQFVEFMTQLEEYLREEQVAIGMETETKRSSSLGSFFGQLKTEVITAAIFKDRSEPLKKLSKSMTRLQYILEDYIERYRLGDDYNKNDVINQLYKRTLREMRLLDVAALLIQVFVKNESLVSRLEIEFSGLTYSVEDFDPQQCFSLVKAANDFLLHGVKYNPENNFFLSQYVLLFINSLLTESKGIYQLTDNNTVKVELKKNLCETAKALLFEENPDAFYQLQYCSEILLKQLMEETHYQGFILSLLEHTLRIGANLNRDLRDKMFELIAEEAKLKHLLPTISVRDQRTFVMIEFNRLTTRDPPRAISLEKFRDPASLKGEMLEYYNYFLISLRTANTLATIDDTKVHLTLIKHYPVRALSEAVRGRIFCPRTIKNELLELMYKVHFKFFKLPLETLPSSIRISVDNANVTTLLSSLESYVDNTIGKVVSEYEWELIDRLGYRTLVEDAHEAFKFWRTKSLEFVPQLNEVDNPKIYDMIELLDGTLLIQSDPDQDGVEKLIKQYEKLLGMIEIESQKIERDADFVDHAAESLQLFAGIQKGRVKLAAKRILETIQARELTNLEDNPESVILDISTDEKQPLVATKSYKRRETKNILASFFVDEFPSSDPAYIENPKLTKLKAANPYSYLLDNLGNEGMQEILEFFLKVIKMKNPTLTNLALRNLGLVLTFEEEVLAEVRKTEYVTDLPEMRTTIDAFQTVTEVYKVVRLFKNSNLIEERSKMLDKVVTEEKFERILKSLSERVESMITTLYNTKKHFKYTNTQNAKETFLLLLKQSKTLDDVPFKINPEAINKNYQEILASLQAHHVLLGLAEVLYQQAERFEFKYNEIITLIRKIYLTLIIFSCRNPDNKRTLFEDPIFRRIIETQKSRFSNETIDLLILVEEILVDNKRVDLEDNAPLSALISEFYLKALSQLEKFKFEQGTWKDYAVINSLPFVSQLWTKKNIELDIGEIVKTYMERVVQLTAGDYMGTFDLKSLGDEPKLFPSDNSLKVPSSYYCLREFLETWELTIPVLKSRKKNIDLMLVEFKPKEWIRILQQKELLHQFELRRLFCETFCRVFKFLDLKQEVFKDVYSLRDLVFILFEDMRAYIEFCHLQYTKGVDLADPSTQKIFDLDKFGIFKTEPTLLTMREEQSKFYANRFHEASMTIYLETIPIKELWTDYIYNGCCKFLEVLLLTEPDLMVTQLTSFRGSITTELVHYYIEFTKKLLEMPNMNVNSETYQRIQGSLKAACTKKSYQRYVVSFKNMIKLANKHEESLVALKTEERKQISHYTLIFDQKLAHVEGGITELLEEAELFEENNIEKLAENLLRNEDTEDIIKEIIFILTKYHNRLADKDTRLLLILLRAPIERERRKLETNIGENINLDSTRKKIIKYQELLQKHEINKLIMSMTIEVKDEGTLKQVFLLAQAYLYGGNKSSQGEMHQALLSDEENVFLVKLYRLLQQKFDLFIENEEFRVQALYQKSMEAKLEHLGDLSEISLDKSQAEKIFFKIQSEFDPILTTDALESKDNDLLMVMLKLLQSMCENQFTLMQNYLRVQLTTNEDGEEVPLPNSENFLELVSIFFNEYHRAHSAYSMEVGQQIVDVLMEMTQGEVTESIKAVIQKSFYLEVSTVITDYNEYLHLLPRGYSCFAYRKKRDTFLAQQATAKARKNKTTDFSDLPTNENYFMILKSKCLQLLISIAQNLPEESIDSLEKFIDKNRILNEFEKMAYEVFGWQKGSIPTDNVAINKIIRKKLRSITNEDLDGVLGDLINIYILFKYIWNDNMEWESSLRELIKESDRSDSEKSALENLLFVFTKRLAASVELVVDRKDNNLIRYWFPVPAQCRYLKREIKTKFLEDVDRSTPQSKIVSLIDGIEDFIPEMEAEYKIHVLKQGFSSGGMYRFTLGLSFVVAVTVNLINLYSIDIGSSEETTYPVNQQDYFSMWRELFTWGNIAKSYNEDGSVKEFFANNQYVLFFISFSFVLLNFIFASLNIILWLITQWKREQRLGWRKISAKYREKIGEFPQSIQKKLVNDEYRNLDTQELKTTLYYKGTDSEEFIAMKKDPAIYKKIRGRYWRTSIYLILVNYEFLWLLTYAIISFLALTHSIFSTLLLADVVIRSDTMKRLIQAVLRNKKQFLWTLFLLCFMALVYTYIGLYYFAEDMRSGTENYCTDAYQCFLNILDMGLRSGGGIADKLSLEDYRSDTRGRYFLRVLFDLSFYMLMIAILLNLIFGMIVDAFGDLRDRKKEAEEDQADVCLICGLDRRALRGLSFDDHRQNDHNIWNYVSFVTYLRLKYTNHRTDMNGIENSIYNAYLEGEYDWFPIERSLSHEVLMRRQEKEKEDEEDQFAQKIQENLDNLKNLKKSLVLRVTELTKKVEPVKKK